MRRARPRPLPPIPGRAGTKMLRCCFRLLPLLGVVLGSPQPLGGFVPPHDHSRGSSYDHDAFLGPEEAKTFEQLSPEESRRRLGLLVPLIDKDGGGAVTLSELRDWLERRLRGAREESVGRAWGRHDQDGDGVVTWTEYRDGTFGDRGDFGDTEHPELYQRLLARDERRFRAADGDGDGSVTRGEFAAFLHPEDFEHMSGVVVTETIEDMDRNGDGLIQEDEYIAELTGGSPDSPEPPWVAEEREQFRKGRDQDGDGQLNRAEVAMWVRPPSGDWAEVEAAHLIHHADGDKDGQLTRAEILAQWQLFVGSRATNYGEDLERPHDEL